MRVEMDTLLHKSYDSMLDWRRKSLPLVFIKRPNHFRVEATRSSPSNLDHQALTTGGHPASCNQI
ncbi:hypothetical protein JCGZ_13645 [Jatropha curcas]|uniref:Uncharacterized protein n=1 Tax=Jatropha curcas TaxID=180498 RepID=A0A067KMM0_JATCU|nr:hypothetical protein JCGZ_13645 [Jatropha curcas]